MIRTYNQLGFLAVLSALSLIPTSAFAEDSTRRHFSEDRHYPTLQYIPQNEENAAPVAAPPIRAIPKGAYTKSTSSSTYDYNDTGLTIGVKTGYRQDKLKWNIAGNVSGTSPNILSELTWEKVGGAQVEPTITYTQPSGFLKGFHVEGSAYRSKTYFGENQDSDYASDDRQGEFSRSNNDADGGHAQGYSAAIGYAFEFSPDRKQNLTKFLALVGYSRQQQKYVMTNGNQTIPATGSFAGLHSNYETDWSMPFIGGSIQQYYRIHRFELRGKYYRGKYYADADWNLRSDFQHPKSYQHKADADGFAFGLEYGWTFYPHAELTLSADWDIFKAEDGLDSTFFSNGNIGSTRLNEVKWEAQQYRVGVAYTF